MYSSLGMQAPEKGMKIKELLKELLPLVTPGADNFDKKTLETQLAKTVILATRLPSPPRRYLHSTRHTTCCAYRQFDHYLW